MIIPRIIRTDWIEVRCCCGWLIWEHLCIQISNVCIKSRFTLSNTFPPQAYVTSKYLAFGRILSLNTRQSAFQFTNIYLNSETLTVLVSTAFKSWFSTFVFHKNVLDLVIILPELVLIAIWPLRLSSGVFQGR